MMRILRRVMAIALGNYIVLESRSYGLHKDYQRLGRFTNLRRAKTFAKLESRRLQARVVVMAADSLNRICVYQARVIRP